MERKKCYLAVKVIGNAFTVGYPISNGAANVTNVVFLMIHMWLPSLMTGQEILAVFRVVYF